MKPLILALLVVFWSFPATAETPELQSRCRNLIIEAKGPPGGEAYGVAVNGTAVTGNDIYPLAGVLHDLGVQKMDIVDWIEKRSRVLSVGEGISELTPFLRKLGVDIEGLDLWYHSLAPFPDNLIGRAMQNYQKLHGDYLVQGCVTELPFADGSKDVIVSHKLFNNLEHEDALKGISEIYRVLAPGGRSTIYGQGEAALIYKIMATEPGRWPKVDIVEIDNRSMTVTKLP